MKGHAHHGVAGSLITGPYQKSSPAKYAATSTTTIKASVCGTAIKRWPHNIK
jgi:hypothetical protein